MQLISVLFIVTSIEAKRRRWENDQSNIKYPINTNDAHIYPQKFDKSVDFGHVYRDDTKRMTDIDSDMNDPRNMERAKELLKEIGKDPNIFDMKLQRTPVYGSPRDELQHKDKNFLKSVNEKIEKNRPLRVKNVTQVIRKPVKEKINKESLATPPSSGISFGEVLDDNDDKEKYFSKHGFGLVSDTEKSRVKNWTTCKEFGKGAVFHPDDVVNLQWVPFYIWSTESFSVSTIHTLEYPTKKLVKEVKEKLEPYLNMRLDWEQPKLLLKETKHILLIAGDRKGLFYGIPLVDLPDSAKNFKIKIPVMIMRLKIIDPYLALSYCNEDYATIMSVSGTEPQTDEDKIEEAKILKFRGIGNPANRNLELEKHQKQFEIEQARREEARKFLLIEKIDDTIDPSWW